MGPAGLGLVLAAPEGEVQAVGDGVFAVVDEVEESADLGEGECDQASMGRWRDFWFGRRAGWVVGV